MSPKVQPSKFLVYVASSFAIILWGMSYIWTDKLLELGIPVFYFVFVRILLAGGVLFLLNAAYGRIKRIQKKDLKKVLLLGICSPVSTPIVMALCHIQMLPFNLFTIIIL